MRVRNVLLRLLASPVLMSLCIGVKERKNGKMCTEKFHCPQPDHLQTTHPRGNHPFIMDYMITGIAKGVVLDMHMYTVSTYANHRILM